jgi:hypothetical protein
LNVKKRTPVYVAATFSIALAASACSDGSAERGSAANANDANREAGETVQVAGCLSGGPDGRVVLTAAPDPAVTTAARVGMGDRDTHSYVLVGGDNLQSHIGKRVEVTGRIVGKDDDMEHEAERETESTPTARREDTPTVTTKEEIEVEIRQLSVAEVREVAPTCQVSP